MSTSRQMVGGLTIALVSMVLIGASLVSALAENRLLPQLPTSTQPPLPTETPSGPTTRPETTLTSPASPSPTFPPPPTECLPPDSWLPYIVLEGDSLESLAAAIGSSPQALRSANCIADSPLAPGMILYLPGIPATETGTPTPSPSPTRTAPSPSSTMIACGPPPGWISYVVQPGDTLYSLAQAYYTSVYQLQVANCLGSSTNIRAGQQLRVPNVSTRTPTPTASYTPSATPTASSTPAASSTPVNTATSAPSATTTGTAPPSPTPSSTPESTPTPTASATSPPPTSTATATQPPPTSTPSTPPGTASPY